MLIVDRAWSEREPALFAANFKNEALAVIASSPKMNEPARKIASSFVGTICDEVSARSAAKGKAVETVGLPN